MAPKSQPLMLKTIALPERVAGRLSDLALIRGWVLLHESDDSDCDVAIRMAADPSESERSGAIGETWWLDGSWVIIVPPGREAPPAGVHQLVHTVPEESGEELWITVIENAARIGRAVSARAQSIKELHHVSIVDAMTQIYNRSHLIATLGKEYKRFQRSGAPLSCIMIDLDHFKNINDTYGHSFGDDVLIAFASLLKENIRESDILGRYGGEEFLCILPNTDMGGACALAEKIRRLVEAEAFSHGFFNVEVTASFGVASSALAEIANPEQLLKWADRALYRAKQTGRNRVSCADGGDEGFGEPGAGGGKLHSRTGKPILLLAHDDPERLFFLKDLERIGSFEIIKVVNSEAAMEFLSHTAPAAALIQCNLRPVSGAALIRDIRGRMADEYFPIAILQPMDLTLEQGGSYHAGADDVLSESISGHEFERRMHVFLRLRLLHERFAETYGRLTAARARLVKAERLSALGQMASGVAHDFNNVLSAILGRTEHMLLHHKDDEALTEELDVIRRAASDGASTIKRIQAFSRSISSLDATAVPIADVVEDCLQLTRVRWKDEAEKHGIKYLVANDVDAALHTSGNPSELREIFTNLILNALDAMPEGGELTIRSRRPEGGERFLIEVRDTGAGMEPGVAKRIFEPFFTTKRERGTGLGLSVVYGILTRMGSHVEVESRPGEGTTFKLWFLPPSEAEEPVTMNQVSAAPVEVSVRPPGPVLTVLVAEDDASVRDLFVDVLREEGHRVKAADCARQAIAAIEKTDFDVVISDLGMPDLPGWDVARAVEERSPDTFMILMSGWSDDFSEEYLASKGVDRWLSKPVSLDELFELLRSIEPLERKDERKLA